MDLVSFGHITTARLRLFPMAEVDPDALVAALNDFEVSRWLGRVPYPYTLEDARDIIARRTATPCRMWAIHSGAALVGGVGLEDHLGYWIARSAWGRGFATEASRAVLSAHFSDPAAGEVGSSYFLGNAASKRVLEKLGFRDTNARDIASISQGRDMPGRAMWLSRDDFAAACGLSKPD